MSKDMVTVGREVPFAQGDILPDGSVKYRTMKGDSQDLAALINFASLHVYLPRDFEFNDRDAAYLATAQGLELGEFMERCLEEGLVQPRVYQDGVLLEAWDHMAAKMAFMKHLLPMRWQELEAPSDLTDSAKFIYEQYGISPSFLNKDGVRVVYGSEGVEELEVVQVKDNRAIEQEIDSLVHLDKIKANDLVMTPEELLAEIIGEDYLDKQSLPNLEELDLEPDF